MALVFSQGDKVAVPVGGGKGLGVDEVFQFELVHAAQEVLAQQGALLLGGSGKVVHGLAPYEVLRYCPAEYCGTL